MNKKNIKWMITTIAIVSLSIVGFNYRTSKSDEQIATVSPEKEVVDQIQKDEPLPERQIVKTPPSSTEVHKVSSEEEMITALHDVGLTEVDTTTDESGQKIIMASAATPDPVVVQENIDRHWSENQEHILNQINGGEIQLNDDDQAAIVEWQKEMNDLN